MGEAAEVTEMGGRPPAPAPAAAGHAPTWTVLVVVSVLLLGILFVIIRVISPSDGTATGAARSLREGEDVQVIIEDSPLRSGDIVVAIEGMPIVDRSLPEIHKGDTLTYQVRRDDQTLDVEVSIGDYPLGVALERQWPSLVLVASVLLVGIYVFVRKPEDPAARALLLIGAFVATGSTAWVLRLQAIDLAGGANWWANLGGTVARIMVWPAVLHFALVFPRPLPVVARHPRLLALVYLFPLVPYAVEVAVYRSRAETRLEEVGALLPTATYDELLFPIAMIVAFAVAYRRANDAAARARLLWVAGTFAAVAVLYLIFWKLPDLVFGHTWGPERMHLLLMSLCPIAIGVAILKVNLFDIHVVVRRSVVYAALTGCVVAIYVLTVAVLTRIVQGRSELVGLVAAGVVAVLFSPVHGRLRRIVSRLLYGDRDDPYAIVARLGRRLEATPEPTELLPQLVATVAEALHFPYAAIELIRGDDVEEVTSFGEEGGEQLVLPLTYRGELVGRLRVGERTPGEGFGKRDRALLGELAGQIGMAVRAARLTLDLQRSRERLVLGREEERRRMRRDLHDGIAPALAATALQLQTARRLIPVDPAAAESILAQLTDHTQRAIADIRHIVDDLRPAALDQLGLVGALQQHASRFSRLTSDNDHNFDVVVHAEGDLGSLPAAIEVAAFRIVCEALNNAYRHGNGRRCTVEVRRGKGIEIDVVDDGCGLPENYRPGVGLDSMRERAAEVGGEFGVEPGPECGTHVWARLPLSVEAS